MYGRCWSLSLSSFILFSLWSREGADLSSGLLCSTAASAVERVNSWIRLTLGTKNWETDSEDRISACFQWSYDSWQTQMKKTSIFTSRSELLTDNVKSGLPVAFSFGSLSGIGPS